jgi:hypothetical protein
MLPDDDLANSNVGSHERKDLLTDVELSLNQCGSSLAPGRLIVRYAMPNGSIFWGDPAHSFFRCT